jgi:hypothetical protein
MQRASQDLVTEAGVCLVDSLDTPSVEDLFVGTLSKDLSSWRTPIRTVETIQSGFYVSELQTLATNRAIIGTTA